jgi:excisionase family DNA binding protein
MAIKDEPINPVHSNISLSGVKDHNFFAEPLWTVEDVADYLQLQPETIRSMARRGELPAIKLGKVWRFQRNAIHSMILSQDLTNTLQMHPGQPETSIIYGKT